MLWTVFRRTPHLQHLLIAERAAPAFIRSREVLERLLLEKLVVAEHGAELARLVHSEGREIGALVARRTQYCNEPKSRERETKLLLFHDARTVR